MPLPAVSIIVPARNEEAVIGSCLESLLASDYPADKLEIIVVADGCTDRTVKIAQSYEPRVKIITSEPKGCKAAALNVAWPAARGEIIGIYDADSLVEPQTISKAVEHFSRPDIIGVSGTLRSSNRRANLLTRALALETCFVCFLEWFLYRCGANALFTGKNMFVRKSILEQTGGFDEASMLEDIELTVRLRRTHRPCWIAFEPQAVVWQQEPPTLKAFWKQRYRWARGSFRIKLKVPSDRPLVDWLVDRVHGLPYYISPFGIIVGTLLAAAVYFKLPLVLLAPLFALFCFNIGLLVGSRLFYRESLAELALLLPIWFVLSNIYSLIITPKSWIDERLQRPFSWYKTPRSV